MLRYLEDRNLIPLGQLAEVHFEDLEHEPLKQIEQIYQTLGIEDFSSAKSDIKRYIDKQNYVRMSIKSVPKRGF